MSTNQDNTLLGPYRVLDLTNEKGGPCGSVLGSMGADVIQIEPPEGSPIRRLPPYYQDNPTIESSLAWWALGANKRSLTLDLDTEGAREVLHKLIQTADFLIESFPPGHLAERGFGWEDMHAAKPSLVYVSITPYGQTGPHSQWAASDINVQAMGGHMYLSGDIERSPIRVGTNAAYWHGGLEAVSGAMIAHHYRRRTGQGQHVDVSMQQCLIWTLLNTTMTWQLLQRQEMRGGAVRKERSNPVYTRLVWECKDGLVLFAPIGGGGGRARAKSYNRFIEWMRTEGHCADILTAKDWNGSDMYNFSQDEYNSVTDYLAKFLKTKTVDELYRRALQEAILLAPINTTKNLANSTQLRDREYYTDVYHPELGRSVEYPGAFAKFSGTPVNKKTRAPFLGEHSQQILAQLGYGAEQINTMRAHGVI